MDLWQMSFNHILSLQTQLSTLLKRKAKYLASLGVNNKLIFFHIWEAKVDYFVEREINLFISQMISDIIALLRFEHILKHSRQKNPIFLELFSPQILAHCVWTPNILDQETHTNLYNTNKKDSRMQSFLSKTH